MKPPPLPDTPTFTWTCGASLRNSSATASVIGNTVDEPSISIVPVMPTRDAGCCCELGSLVSLLHPTSASASATTAITSPSVSDAGIPTILDLISLVLMIAMMIRSYLRVLLPLM